LIDALETLGQADPKGLSAAIEDFNGDQLDDFVISYTELTAPDEPTPTAESLLLIYLCDRDQFRLEYANASLPNADRIHISQIRDLNSDGLKELLVMQELCGAHTCTQAWQVLAWQRGEFVNALVGRTDDLPSPILEIIGPLADGFMSLELTGTGVPSAGAGPSRTITRVWRWSTTQARFTVFEERLSAPVFRIHALHDADQAALTGQTQTAIDGYLRVIEDPALDDYPYGEEGHTQLSAYALYRSMLIWLELGDLVQAESAYTFLREVYSGASAFVDLAQEVWEAYLTTDDLDQSCQIGRAYAQAHPELVLSPLNYGYANKIYTAVDVCPYGGS
jgi:hypothetical protein